MKLKYLQENQLFKLVGGSRKSKASLFVVFVVVVVAAARLELRSPRFKVISRVFLEVFGRIPSILQSFSNFPLNSSKELTIMEQRTLAQRRPRRRRPARTQITGLSYACAWVHIENPFSLSCT